MTAEVDEQHLGNTLSNLLDNAIKYSGEKKPILSVEIYKKEKKLGIKVKDNGIGMDKEELKNIFKKFYRAPTGNIHNVKGFGLRLYYVSQVSKAHHWDWEIESKIGKGTSILFKIKQ